jgi:hypothetical protein
MYWINSSGQRTRGGLPAWWLGEVLTTPHRKNVSCYEMFTQWRGSAAARFLWLYLRIPPGAWLFVWCKCCALSGRGLCVGWSLVQRNPTECVCVCECDHESSIMRRLLPTGGCCVMVKKKYGEKCVIKLVCQRRGQTFHCQFLRF